MESVEFILPHILLWSKTTLAECGLDPDLKYHSAQFKTLNGTPLITGYLNEEPVSHTLIGDGATLFDRLICIQAQSAAKDNSLHATLLEAGDRVILSAIFNVESKP